MGKLDWPIVFTSLVFFIVIFVPEVFRTNISDCIYMRMSLYLISLEPAEGQGGCAVDGAEEKWSFTARCLLSWWWSGRWWRLEESGISIPPGILHSDWASPGARAGSEGPQTRVCYPGSPHQPCRTPQPVRRYDTQLNWKVSCSEHCI